MWASVIFLTLVVGSVVNGTLPVVVLFGYVVLSLITFVAYAFDKSAAQRGAWRTSESTLHLMSLLGGWPGALVAQESLRHKSRKESFRAAFWVTVVVNVVAFGWLHTPDGRAALDNYFSLIF